MEKCGFYGNFEKSHYVACNDFIIFCLTEIDIQPSQIHNYLDEAPDAAEYELAIAFDANGNLCLCWI